jgi:hypothetical protein
MWRIPSKDLEILVQSAQPNVVIYTRAEHKAWIIEDMLVELPMKNQDNKTKAGLKRSIQTTLLATGAIQCTAERFAPTNFPPQASPINRLIPQLLTLNRPLRNSILREYETLCRQPERDILGIIREGTVERWNHKSRIYQELGIPWKAPEILSKAERMRVKRDRRMHNTIRQWPLYVDWPGTLQERRRRLRLVNNKGLLSIETADMPLILPAEHWHTWVVANKDGDDRSHLQSDTPDEAAPTFITELTKQW